MTTNTLQNALDHKDFKSIRCVTITDYNDDDAHGLVRDSLYLNLEQHDINIQSYNTVNAGAFNTLETGYLLGRRALNPLGTIKNQIFFVNTAPRKANKGAKKTNEGEGFCLALLKNGQWVFAVNSGLSLAFVKPEIDRFYKINVPDNIEDIPEIVETITHHQQSKNFYFSALGQFRSAYIYPLVIAKILSANLQSISPTFDTLFEEEQQWPKLIPDVPENTIVYVDGYGNIKFHLKENFEKKASVDVIVTCPETSEKRSLYAQVTHGIFGAADGEITLAKGSSVFKYSDAPALQLIECVRRGGSAQKTFADRGNLPQVGWKINLR